MSCMPRWVRRRRGRGIFMKRSVLRKSGSCRWFLWYKITVSRSAHRPHARTPLHSAYWIAASGYESMAVMSKQWQRRGASPWNTHVLGKGLRLSGAMSNVSRIIPARMISGCIVLRMSWRPCNSVTRSNYFRINSSRMGSLPKLRRLRRKRSYAQKFVLPIVRRVLKQIH